MWKEEKIMSFIRKVLGVFSSSLSGSDSYSGWIKQLDDYLHDYGRHKKLEQDVIKNILSYVANGDTTSILDYVAKNEGDSDIFQLKNQFLRGKSDEKRLEKLYENFEFSDVNMALRWAKLLEASISKTPHVYYSYNLKNDSHWLEILLLHAAGASIYTYESKLPDINTLSYQHVEKMLVADGLQHNSLILSVFSSPVKSNHLSESRLLMIKSIRGFSQGLEHHLDTINSCLLNGNVSQRLHMINLLQNANDFTLGELASKLVMFAISSSKQVRSAAIPLIQKSPRNKVVDALQIEAKQAKPESRMHALRLLYNLASSVDNTNLIKFVTTTAESDSAESVKALLQEWNSLSIQAALPTSYTYAVPSVDWQVKLTQEVTSAVDILWNDIDNVVNKLNKKSKSLHEKVVTIELKKNLYDYLILPSHKNNISTINYFKEYQLSNLLTKPIADFAIAPGINSVTLLKTLVFFGVNQSHEMVSRHLVMAFNALYEEKKSISLLELQQLLEPLEVTPQAILHKYCSTWEPLGANWRNEDVWPFFAHHLEVVNQALTTSSLDSYWFDRAALYKAIRTLPIPPESIIGTLFNVALGSAKAERIAAQDALSNLPGKENRIINALSDGKGDVRTIAAQWLTRLNYAPAKNFLEQAVVKEKNDVAKAAMLDALMALGESVEKYLSVDNIKLQAAKSLAKGIPKDLEWFPWSAIPAVKWKKSNENVSQNVLSWLIVQAFKQKSAEPNAILRKYTEMFEPLGRERFGQFVLEAWLNEDIKPLSPDLAMQQAQSHAQYLFSAMKSYPQYWESNPHFGKSVEELTSASLPGFLRQPAGSAISSKGVLAVSAACASEHAAEPVRQYLREYYGTRAAQGRALIAMLSWIEHPSATQLMLSIGNRFRTKSIQEEASRQATALAERKGWTLSELADRTIPSAGFDESGELQLSYGQRSFTVKLLDDLSVRLFNPEEKEIKALPEPRLDDDAAQAKDSKKAFTSVKKEIKAVIDMQTERLYEALCIGKQWKVNDWQLYLNQHPIMRRLIQKLIWLEHDGENIIQSFRPLDDGTLTDTHDNEVKLSPTANIRLAHDSFLSGEQITQWQAHLQDYEVNPLFQQLGKGVYALPEDKNNLDQIGDFEGYLIEAYPLRNRAMKLGYTRGDAQDGGWFMTYEKRFIDLGITSVIEFTGNPLPEENRTVSLLSLYFTNSQSKGWARDKIALHRVPKVLLSESYNDMGLISAEGSGYDAEWQKKSEY